MSLIKCPECGKEVSDKSQNCIHCGYPINSHKVIMENINGVDYDVSFLADMSLSQWEKLGKMLEITGNDFENAMKAKEIVLKYHPTKTVEESRKPHCPTCQSTNLKKVSTASKAGSIFMWGLLSQKVKKTWHCNNCGYEW